MLYMVEMELPDRSEVAAWHEWYINHIHKLLALPGFNGSQRFEALTPTPSPFLAIHDVDGPAFFDSPGYKGSGGPVSTGEWQSKMTNWYRNLFSGLEVMPEVAADQHLVVCENGADVPAAHAERVKWLDVVALDRTEERRGVLILDAGESPAAFAGRAGIRVFRPLTGKLT
jgi:hypothetical protein